MSQAKQGDAVKVHYTGKLADGTVFDSSESGEEDIAAEPFAFTIGTEQVIPGFEQAVIGMAVGEAKTVTIPVAGAYGNHMEQMVAVVKKSDIPPNITPEVGQHLEITQEDGSSFPVIITAVTDEEVTLDANHPLAGHDLTFEIKLVAID